MTREPAVRTETRGHILVVTLNRPDQRNNMSPELLDGFHAAMRHARQKVDARCVVVRGTGSCFSAGADLRGATQRTDQEHLRLAHEKSFGMYEAFLSVLDLEVPVVGALTGHAVGGGFGLALLCDLRIANAEAKYGANFVRLGLHPGLGITYTLPRLVGEARAAELLYAARLIRGAELVQMGLANAAVPEQQVMSRAMELATQIAACAPAAVRMTKRSLRGATPAQIRRAARQEAFAQAESLATHDAREGMQAWLDKREPRFQGF